MCTPDSSRAGMTCWRSVFAAARIASSRACARSRRAETDVRCRPARAWDLARSIADPSHWRLDSMASSFISSDSVPLTSRTAVLASKRSGHNGADVPPDPLEAQSAGPRCHDCARLIAVALRRHRSIDRQYSCSLPGTQDVLPDPQLTRDGHPVGSHRGIFRCFRAAV